MSGIQPTENPNDNLFHSNEYAKEAYGETIGAMSPQTFAERLRIEKNRQEIKHYRDSMIAREHDKLNRHRAESKNQQSFVPDQTNKPQQPLKPSSPTSNSNTRIFREPPSRGYNPYS